jgi:DNA-binding response OmpR family regulator
MKRKILIIDDEVDLCMLIKNYLVQRGYEVYTTNTLTEGLTVLAETNPDILLLDNNLPDGFGWSQAPGIQKKFPSLRITLVSAFETTAAVPSAEGIAFRILEKPISLSKIESFL